MAAAKVEDVLCDILSNLFACNIDQLGEISKQLNITVPEDPTKMIITAAIKDHITKEEIKGAEDQGLAYYMQVLAVVKVQMEEKEDLKERIKELEAQMAKKVTELQIQLDASTKGGWRKDLRIVGQIGETGQKDKLSFTSLARQLEAAVRDNRKEAEIVDAILKAISPGLRLRSYLEGMTDLTLGKLRRLLRAHYQEKDATALFHELTGAAQANGETPQQYLLRLLDLRQKIIFASQEDNSGLVYNPALVQQMFTKSFCTGLQGLSIRAKMEHLLADGKITDEVLMERLNIAVATEVEVKQKRATVGRQAAKVQEVSVETAASTNKATNHDNLKASILKELKDDVQNFLKAEVKAAFSQQQQQQQQQRASNPPQHQRPQRPRGCNACQAEDIGATCQHCFKCGSSNHYARGCRVRRNTPGNDNRLQRGDKLQSSQ